LKEALLFETELLGGLENKEYSQLSESWDPQPQCLGGRQPQEVVVERERESCETAEKVNQPRAWKVKDTVFMALPFLAKVGSIDLRIT
jgi:hypothetical protein